MLRAVPLSPVRCGSGRRVRGAATRAPLQVLAVRNRGRLRDPYDTPLRDGNRDRCEPRAAARCTRAAAVLAPQPTTR